jgi:hypothetical protein
MADDSALLTETAGLLAARELVAIDLLRAAPGLAPDLDRADAAARLLAARTGQLRRITRVTPAPSARPGGRRVPGWPVLAVTMTVASGLEAAFFRSLAAHLPTPDEEQVRALLDAEPDVPGLLWLDAGRVPLESRRALHRVMGAAAETLLTSAELAAALGRAGTLELIADTLDAFPGLVARAAVSR